METKTGTLQASVGAPGGVNISPSWINPDKDKLMTSAGYFYEKDLNENSISNSR